MASTARRGMDWPTAWSALVPIYALAAVLQAFFPPFAVPTWAIFVIYGLKVLDGARTVKDPWAGRSSPRAYLIAFVPTLVLHLIAFTVIAQTAEGSLPAFGDLVLYWLSFLVAVGLAAVFVAASAPPHVRSQRWFVRAGVIAELLSGLLATGLLTAVLPAPPSGLAVLVASVGTAILSFAAFSYAGHVGRERSEHVARRVPKA